jgi:hypothetical protein
MESVHGTGIPSEQLIGVVRGVRNRYRAKRALRGAAITVAASWAILAASAYVMNAMHYGDGAVLGTRIVALLAIVVVAVWFIALPLRPAFGDDQVALYLEEHEQSLKASVITAVEMQRGGAAQAGAMRSPALIERLTRAALDRVHKANDGRAIDAGELRANGGILAAVLAAAVLLTTFGPPILRNGIRLIAAPWSRSEATTPFSIAVDPGNATVAKGGDELIEARLRGFQSDGVELLVRRADSTTWTRVPMTPDSTGRYAFRLFDIGSKTQYAVEANGVRSTTYVLDVSNLPYVKRLDLQYRFPDYTQMKPLDIDSTGDIAALRGTMVRIRVASTVPTTGGRVVVDGGDTLKLVPTDDGHLVAMLRVEKPGFYKVELQGPDGKMVTGSLDYTIDVLPDRPPTVQFVKPGRDQKVLSVDEVYTEARAEDDYGVAKLDLVYSVNGGDERTMPLHEGTRAIHEISAGYTFMLEGMKLEPGDVVSYYARATDNNAVSGAQRASTDIYFMQVRPYENDYRQRQGGGGGGGGGQPDDAGQLSQKQRDIIAATFKTTRDSAATEKKALEENLATIRLSQQRLREQANQLADRLKERGIAASDSNWKKIAEILPKAAAEMDSAEKKLGAGSPQSALQPEQRALQQLQRAEAVFREIQVSMGGGGGGGGGGQKTDAQDLADIFELQKDKLRNQYETVQRGQQQSQQQQKADNQVDETLEKLRQLAARQQQENDRARRKADSLSQVGQSGASGGQSQRDMAQQTEEQAHQLERLAREQQSQALADAARRLQDAATAMRKAAANGGGQKGADAQQALNNLQEARRLLDQEKNGRSGRDLNDAARAAQQLADQEKKVQSDVQKLSQSASDAAGQQQLKQSIAEQKGAMAEEVKDLKSKLDRMALDSKRDQREVSRALETAADTLRGRKVEEKLRYTQQQARSAPADWLNSAEQQISGDIADLGQRIQQAQAAAQAGDSQRQQGQAADKARELVRGLESMDERMRQRAEQGGSAGRQGQQQNGQQQNGQQQNGQQQNGQQQQGAQGQRGGQGQQQNAQQGKQSGQQSGQQGQRAGQQGQQGQGQQAQQGQGQQGQAQQGQGQQGQGQQGQQGRGEGHGQQMGGGNPTSNGNPNGSGPPGGGMPQRDGARLSPDDAQQFSREAAQRLADAENLRKELAAKGVPTKELDRAIDNLRQLTNPRVLEDTRAAADLRSKTLEGFKDFEFGLRRALGGADSTRVLLERAGDVPPAYKQNVEEYYRSIGRGKSTKPETPPVKPETPPIKP